MTSQTKILLVEDLKVAQIVAFDIFKKLNLNFEIATTGAAALERIVNYKYDLIFVDIQLPSYRWL